ncbi:MAG: methionine--tRNA ligase subunit beta [Nanoarchaeota archaeon]
MIETIKFSDWQKLDLRVAKILRVEDIEGADKLYKLSVDLGKELGKRTLVAGIKPYYKKEQLKNRQCIIFTNLEPRKIKGIESQGMILASVNADERKVFLLQPDSKIEEGSRIR